MESIKVPKDRLPILIGKNGEAKKEIEDRTGARLTIDSESGEVFIDTTHVFEPLLALTVMEIIKSISRGFSPERAYRLLQDDVFLKIIDIKTYSGKNKSRTQTLRSRVIGSEGKTRKTIEAMTGAEISIYGNTVAIIGEATEIEIAETAMDMLLNGVDHSGVYKFLDSKRKQLRMARF